MRLTVIAVTGAVLFAFLARPLVENTVPVESDLGRYHLPLRDYYQKQLHAGEQPGWFPGAFCGYDAHGEGQGGFDHPWHRALYQLLPLTVAFNFEVFVNYPLLCAGMYFLFRRHWFPRDAALTGALAMTFSGFTLPHYPHTNAIAIVAHVPWLLLAADVYWRGETARQRSLAGASISLLSASQILLGYPQYVYFSGLAEGVYILFLVRETPSWGRLAGWVLAKVLGVMTGGAQLLPSLEALRLSPRMGYTRHFRGTFSLPPAMGLQLVAPTMFNEFMQLHEYTVYAGVVATVGLVWILVRPGRVAGGRESNGLLGRWALTIALVAVPLALGKYTAFFRLYLKLPVVGVFRCPCRYLVLVHFAAAVLTATVVRDLGQGQPTPWKRLVVLALVPLAAWPLAALGPTVGSALPSDVQPFLAPGGAGWAGAIVLTVATGLFILAARRVPGALALLVVVGLADLGYYGLRAINVYSFTSLDDFRARETRPPAPPAGRADIGDVHGNALTMQGWRLTSGYVGLTPPRVLDFSRSETQRLAGTTWRHDGREWHPVEGLPRVRLVTQGVVSTDPRADLASIDPAAVALVDRPVELSGGEPGSVSVIADRPGVLELVTRTPAAQLLIVAESFHPGWAVTLDGRPTRLLRAYGDFQAAAVPPGEHRVTFRFSSASRTQGLWLSAVGLTATIGWALVSGGVYPRRSGQPVRRG